MKLILIFAAVLVQIFFLKCNGLQPLLPWATTLSEWISSALHFESSPLHWLYGANLLSQKDLIPASEKRAFISLGLYHLLVVSGGHIKALETLATWMTPQTFGVWKNRFLHVLLIFFTLANRLDPSCFRALVSWNFQKLSPRRISILDQQLAVTLFCLLLNPSWVTSLGFQLSSSASLALSMSGKSSLIVRTAICVLMTAPLLWSLQPCLSWIILPANTLGGVVFEFLFFPVTLISATLPPVRPILEPILNFAVENLDSLTRFEEPRFCIYAERMPFWESIYFFVFFFLWRLAVVARFKFNLRSH